MRLGTNTGEIVLGGARSIMFVSQAGGCSMDC
jgi:hypothetical protein